MLASMKRGFQAVGVLAAIAFVATGVYLYFRLADIAAANASARYSLRANHIYIIMSALVNLALGLLPLPRSVGWRAVARRIGGPLVMLAPALLLGAFVFEGPRPSPQRPLTSIGVLILAVGVILIVASARRTEPESVLSR